VEFEAVKKPSEFPSCKIKSLPKARGMSQENPISKQPLICHVNRQRLSWRAVDLEHLIGEDHPARAIWALVGRLDRSAFYQAIESSTEEGGRPAIVFLREGSQPDSL
jgi:hypothetical protein